MAKQLKGEITGMDMLGLDIYKMTICSEDVAAAAQPGQFVNIRCGGLDALLRRPISICDVNKSDNTFDIVFQVKGSGTEQLCRKCSGEADILAPLGKAFDLSDKYKNICVVGGGIGTFPLLFLLKSSNAEKKTALLGFRNKAAVVLENQFRAAATKVDISTDDGSYGKQAFVTDMLEQHIVNQIESGQKPDIVYTCGPNIMMRKVAVIAEKYNIPCQVSMEQRMGCGIGACLVCACKTKQREARQVNNGTTSGTQNGTAAGTVNGTKNDDNWEYSHVCKDGPVYWSTAVIWE